MVRQPLNRFFRRVFLQIVMQQGQQRDRRDLPAARPARHPPRFGREQHHVQNHAVIGSIPRVAMRIPVRGVQVYFDVTRHFGAISQHQQGRVKIRSTEQIPFAGINDAHGPAIRCHGGRAVKIAPQPDFLQQFFRKRKRPVESLDFGYDGTTRAHATSFVFATAGSPARCSIARRAGIGRRLRSPFRSTGPGATAHRLRSAIDADHAIHTVGNGQRPIRRSG